MEPIPSKHIVSVSVFLIDTVFFYLPVQALWGSSSSSLSVGESSVGEWLQRLGLERYEQGLLHNGWDDLEFLRYIHSHTQTC